MYKKRSIFSYVAVVLITAILTFGITNFITLKVGEKVVISRQNYEYYEDLDKTYGKMISLKNYIDSEYYTSTDDKNFEDSIIKGLFSALDDPYSVYMGKKEFDDFMTHTSGTYGGIGVIMTPGKDGFITVVAPIEDTPGEKAGLKSNDKILKVNGKEVTADKLDEAVTIIKGEAGTKVNLTVLRPETEKTFGVDITRQNIRLKTVKSKIMDNNIGYMRISMFDEQTAKDFKTHLSRLEKENINGLIIDLRNNPGGLLSQCTEIADLLLGKGTIVYTQDRTGKKTYEKSDESKVDFPYVLLVNKGSASASEILAGAVKDTNSGVLIGTTTFGKGLVQQVKPLKDGTGFKLTTAQYFTPNGTYIHGKGIDPNIVVELPVELKEKISLSDKEDVQLQKALEVVNEKIANK
ncbi:MAG: S41 family peptidase [Anaeromicrobium sp.]|jgi:carboxyl-terminal processing protease|uniref:S41 family peptidase n=1 Tax=Anaeromicrobium sp. TaxID=1929132 RepID=UPI0025F3FCBE|nr:S41 family peptidase [Anaeromicrobium sp.]MCT4595735.1 S41 family peptidase [Anaeromicrobium sp.]